MSELQRWVVISVLILFSGSRVHGGDNAATKGVTKIFEDYWQFRLSRAPEWATYLGDHRYDDKVSDYSAAARDRNLASVRQYKEGLSGIDRKSLSPADQLNVEVFQRVLDEELESAAWPEHLMPIKQQNSPQIALGMIRVTHPFKTLKDYENYGKRLRAFPKQVDDLIAWMDEGIKKGVVRPKITIEQALPQIDAMITDKIEDCELYEPAKTLPEEFKTHPYTTAQDPKALVAIGTAEAVTGLKKLRTYLRETYLPKCRDTVGYCHLPNGKTWYKRLAKYHTTTDLTPEQIHQIGLDELKRIHAEMVKIAREVGFEGDAKAFIDKMRADPRQHNTSAADMMRRHREILRKSDAQLPKLFGRLPKTPCELKEIESFRAAAAPDAYYYEAPEDNSRPAYFYVNVYKPETRPIYTMEALAYHEAQPGHHLQIALAREHDEWPTFRRFTAVTAFIEGWGLYSESLGFDLGGYKDPYSRFGALSFDAWRASRLVVDTGMHDMGWTRQQAIDFMKNNTGLSEQNIISEIDRYIAWPGQALAYTIGKLEILKLRAECEKKLGAKFDIRAFHDELLGEGSLPLSTVRERMTRWVEKASR